MKSKKYFYVPLAGAFAAICASIITPAQADTPVVTELSSGKVSVYMRGCSVLFDEYGSIISPRGNCTNAQWDDAQRAYDGWRREQGGGYRGGDEYDRPYSEGGAGYGGETRITCESSNGGYQYCRTQVGNGSVRLTDRLSRSRCDEGDDWGYDRDGVWVNHGCRAEFTISSSGGSYGGSSYGGSYDRVTCESANGGYQYCRASVGSRRVVLVDRRSSHRCEQGDDWNYDKDGIWVQNGCRAEFEIR